MVKREHFYRFCETLQRCLALLDHHLKPLLAEVVPTLLFLPKMLLLQSKDFLEEN